MRKNLYDYIKSNQVYQDYKRGKNTSKYEGYQRYEIGLCRDIEEALDELYSYDKLYGASLNRANRLEKAIRNCIIYYNKCKKSEFTCDCDEIILQRIIDKLRKEIEDEDRDNQI